LVKWLRTIVVLMFKAFAIVSLKRVDHLWAPSQYSHPVPHLVPFPVTKCLKDPFSPISPPLSSDTLASVERHLSNSDFHPVHAFLHEELDNIPLRHFFDKSSSILNLYRPKDSATFPGQAGSTLVRRFSSPSRSNENRMKIPRMDWMSTFNYLFRPQFSPELQCMTITFLLWSHFAKEIMNLVWPVDL
jgi:hypothetical protein